MIFRLTESNPGLFDTGADSVGKMELLPVLWTHFRYRFLWEGSPEPDAIDVWRRLLQSVFKVEWSTFSVKLPFFSRIWARDRKIFTGVFPNLGSKKISLAQGPRQTETHRLRQSVLQNLVAELRPSLPNSDP